MAGEDPTRPIAPAGTHLRSDDVELASFAKPPPRRNQRRSSKCFVYALALIVILCAASLGFALTVLRVKTPELRLRHVDVRTLSYSTTATTASSSASLNATLVGEAVLRNTNFGRFEFLNGTAVSVIYGGTALGGGKISGGRARAREREKVTVKMEVRSSELAADGRKNLTSDVGSGMVKLTSYAKMRGRVTVVGWIKRWRTAEMNCTMSLDLRGRMVRDLRCN
ncbi:late embryogenesis abundant protein At1g64065-like [Rhodamnia argentea]|uniref:Late embryogenesis abundant protein At1g64065-like n=1 Tax=Rhodamnia argentea TaxID=178133 RepID=A0A8B8P6K3_9MYRT|nr:late embryogenesis abundant protein At1g64065-like [Rhodamnia argentea]